MTGGSLLGPLAVYTWSRVETLAELYLAFAAVGLAMSCILYEPAFIVITKWLPRSRRKAIRRSPWSPAWPASSSRQRRRS